MIEDDALLRRDNADPLRVEIRELFFVVDALVERSEFLLLDRAIFRRFDKRRGILVGRVGVRR